MKKIIEKIKAFVANELRLANLYYEKVIKEANEAKYGDE